MTIRIPTSWRPTKLMPKIRQERMTEAAGSLAAVMSACCGDRYMRPALYKRKAVTVPKRMIHATPKKICGSKKAS